MCQEVASNLNRKLATFFVQQKNYGEIKLKVKINLKDNEQSLYKKSAST